MLYCSWQYALRTRLSYVASTCVVMNVAFGFRNCSAVSTVSHDNQRFEVLFGALQCIPVFQSNNSSVKLYNTVNTEKVPRLGDFRIVIYYEPPEDR